MRHLKFLIETKGSAVLCVAEGAGQNFLGRTNATDASGNTVLGDFGVHIQQEFAASDHFSTCRFAFSAYKQAVETWRDQIKQLNNGERDHQCCTVQRSR
ncbi:hypothetical protein SADUNF_Sadunf07G0008900 [Salix dunnii]|uniref:Uncharacterized protein n=1 Tax=Salix dunnii TaxID=1413687 RepID=A0A835MYJ8_9ROSI|nr:hypothetical protein SADUNF_Sadunf07G0008900 [Salix dunnii]